MRNQLHRRALLSCGLLKTIDPFAFGVPHRLVWHTSIRLCSTGSPQEPHLAGGVSLETGERQGKEDARAHFWNDNTVLSDIARIICRHLPQCGTSEQMISDDTHEVKSFAVHRLFQELGPELRYQLQNSSFGFLDRALQSKPEWFVLSNSKSNVSCTDAAFRHLEERSAVECGPVACPSHNASDVRGGAQAPSFSESKGIVRSCKSMVLVHGSLVSTPMDVSRPPVTAEEVEQLKLKRLVYPLCLHFLVDNPPVTLFPSGAKPRRLSQQLEEWEALYVAKGFFPPSDVAAAFIHITPTYFVETRHVLNAISPDVALSFERHVPKDHIIDVFFKKYPMIFKLKTRKFQRASVKLNLDFSFIRDYPGCGRADRPLRRYNQEYRATVGGLSARPLPSTEPVPSARRGGPPIDVKIFEVLVRNLPRVPTDPSIPKQQLEERRHQPFPLVQWINGFSPDDIGTLNCVPQARVLTLMARYVRIFQLLCHGEDGNIFTEWKYFHQKSNRGQTLHTREVNMRDTCAKPEKTNKDEHGEVVDVGVDDEDVSGEAPDTAPIVSEAEVKRREANLSAALRDDLIGLDDMLCESGPTGTEIMMEELEQPGEEDTVGSLGRDGKEKDDGDSNECSGCDSELNATAGRAAVLPSEEVVQVGDTENTEPSPFADSEDQGDFYIPSRYDIIYVRRLPKHIAPRSLSDYNAVTSPEPELLQYLVSFLNPPPSLQGKLKKGDPSALNFVAGKPPMPWRWVPVQRIYSSLSKERKRLLRPYKGLVHFMRLHGEVFELSDDFLHVIAHDPEGKIPPFVPTQTVFNSEDRVLLPPTFDDDGNSKAALIGDAERNKFRSILGASQIPTDRRQLLLLDPQNPLLDHEVLCEEVSLFMPDHPVSMQQLMMRLPPILKAALSHRHRNNFKSSKHLTVWCDGTRTMLQKSKLGVPEAALREAEALSIEDAIECIREVVPDEGIVVGQLQRMLPSAAKRTLKTQFGGVHSALLGYPQYFYIEKNGEDRNSSVLFLVEQRQRGCV